MKEDTDVEAKRQKRLYTNRNSGSCTDDNTTISGSRKRPNSQVTSLPTNPFVASGSVGSGGGTSNGAPTAACGETPPISIIGESDLSIDNSLVISDYSQTSQPTKTPATNARYADGIYIYPDGGCSSDYDNDSITPSKDIVEIHGNKSVTVGGALKESQRENDQGLDFKLLKVYPYPYP